MEVDFSCNERKMAIWNKEPLLELILKAIHSNLCDKRSVAFFKAYCARTNKKGSTRIYCRINIIFKVLIQILCLVLFYINSQQRADEVISPMAYTIISTGYKNKIKKKIPKQG